MDLMKTKLYLFLGAFVCTLLLSWLAGCARADDTAKVAGNWDVSVETPRGTMNQKLVLQQDGEKITGTLTGRRGESPLEGTVSGDKISFTVTRERQNGSKFTIDYTGTVAGDSISGEFKSERFSGKWTAKKSGS
jgi:hypothetical protein